MAILHYLLEASNDVFLDSVGSPGVPQPQPTVVAAEATTTENMIASEPCLQTQKPRGLHTKTGIAHPATHIASKRLSHSKSICGFHFQPQAAHWKWRKEEQFVVQC